MKNRFKIIVASALIVCLVFGMLLPQMFSVSAEETYGVLNVSGFSATMIDGNGNKIEIPDDTPLRDGTKLNIMFSWTIDDSDRSSTTFRADIQSLCTNVTIEDYPETVLTRNNGQEEIGTVKISGGYMYVTLHDDVAAENNRGGGSSIDGIISINAGQSEDNTIKTLKIGDKTYDIIYDAGDNVSSLYVYKSTTNPLTNVPEKASLTGDVLTQTFYVKIGANTGKVTDIRLTDEAGAGLSNMSEITVIENNTAEITGVSYADFAEFAAAFAGKTLYKDEYIIIEYSMQADKGIYDQTDGGNGISDAYGNKISASYTNDNGDMKNVDSGNVKVNVTKPSVSKTGTIDSDNKTVEWTITVNLGDFYDASGTFDETVTSISDIPCSDLTGAVITASDFKEGNEAGTYVCTYTTAISEDVFDRLTDTTLTNTFSALIEGHNYEAVGSVTQQGRQWLSKEFISENAGVITWKVVMSEIPSGIKNVILYDSTTDWCERQGNHILNPDISVTYNDGSGQVGR